MMRKIISYFMQGILYLAPVGITIYILVMTYRLIADLITKHLPQISPYNEPFIGIIILFTGIAFIGFIGQTVIANPIKVTFRKIIEKAPLIKLIYSSLKDLLSAFVGKEKKFNKPVLVKVNTNSNLEKLGFVTQEDLSHLKIQGNKVAVYFPHSYNFSGELFIVPAENITELDESSSEVMKFIVSGGISYDKDPD